MSTDIVPAASPNPSTPKELARLAKKAEIKARGGLPAYADPNRPYVGNPWERQPYETDLGFQVFVYYRDMDPMDRSLRVADDWYREKRGLKPIQQTRGTQSGSVVQWSRVHRWSDRVRMFDAEQDARQAIILQRRRNKAMERHADDMVKAQTVAMRPVSVMADRITAGEDDTEELSDKELMELGRRYLQLLPELQKAERDALGSNSSAATETTAHTAKMKVMGEYVKKMLNSAEASETIEGVMIAASVEVTAEQSTDS